jgi:hypothetical protein
MKTVKTVKTAKTTNTATAVATAALAAILSALPACGDLKDNTIPVDKVAYTPDGSLVLFTVAGIYVFDGLLQTQITHIPLDPLGVPPGNVSAIVQPAGTLRFSLSADGTTAAVSYSPNDDDKANTQVAIYGMPGGDLLRMFEVTDAANAGQGDKVMDLALSPDASWLYISEIIIGTNGDSTATAVLDATTGVRLWTKDGGRELPVWSPDGATLFSSIEPAGGQPGAPLSALEALDARTGESKWTTDPTVGSIVGLAVTGNGALLAGAIEPPPCGMSVSDCPPFYPFWSSADGTALTQVESVPDTWEFAAGNGNADFVCNAADTCVMGLNHWNPRVNFMHIYKTDGTVLWDLPTPTGKAVDSSAISPDGNFITIANPYDANGGASVYSIYGRTVIGAHFFPFETF